MPRNFCKQCGAPLTPDDETCPGCGRVLEPLPEQAPEKGASIAAEVYGALEASETETPPEAEMGTAPEPPASPEAPLPPPAPEPQYARGVPRMGHGSPPPACSTPPGPYGYAPPQGWAPGPNGYAPPGYAPGPDGYPFDPRRMPPVEMPEAVSFSSALTMCLIGLIPLVGLVYLFVQAMQSPGRPNRRSFARGLLTARLILLMAVLVLLIFLLFSTMMRRLFYLP